MGRQKMRTMNLYHPILIALILAFTLAQQIPISEVKSDQPKFLRKMTQPVVSEVKIDKPKYLKTYIGVMTQPNTYYIPYTDENWSLNNSYIATSVVPFVEQSGAVALLVPWDLPLAELTAVLDQTNGLFFP